MPHRPIEVLFTVAEEVYTKGSAVFDFAKVMSEEAYVLDLAGPVGTAAYMAPSILVFTATIHGRASHAGLRTAKRGFTPIAAAADAISMMPMGRLGRGDLCQCRDESAAASETNIIPDKCVVRGGGAQPQP